jgi:hypothetical protein
MPSQSTIDDVKRALQLAEQIQSLEGELNSLLSRIGSATGATTGSSKSSAGSAGPASKPAKASSGGKKRGGGMSAEGRARIIAAQKARWARVRAAAAAAQKGGKAPSRSAGKKRR